MISAVCAVLLALAAMLHSQGAIAQSAPLNGAPHAGGTTLTTEPNGTGGSGGAPLSGSGSIGTPLAGWATVDAGQGPGHAAAGPALRKLLGGDPAFRGDVVTVTSEHGSVTVRLTDWCACGDRHGKPTIIDLDETDFRALTGRGPGVEWVTISSATSSIALPQTDCAGPC